MNLDAEQLAAKIRSYFADENDDPAFVRREPIHEISFGEYLVEVGVISRFQLFQAMGLADRVPNLRIGACLVVLCHMTAQEVAHHLHEWNNLAVVLV